MRKFFINQELSARSICDHECIYTGRILRRTAKTVTVKTDEGVKRCKIHLQYENEYIYPFGRYSMAATFYA